MEKEIKDFEKMSAEELLMELTDRLIVEQKSKDRMTEYLVNKGWNEEDAEDVGGDEWYELKNDNDEDWCRIRELVRFIKKDDTLWTC